jgi:hypothetical protein
MSSVFAAIFISRKKRQEEEPEIHKIEPEPEPASQSNTPRDPPPAYFEHRNKVKY